MALLHPQSRIPERVSKALGTQRQRAGLLERPQTSPSQIANHKLKVTAVIHGHNPRAGGRQCPSGFSNRKRKANMKKKTPSDPLPLAESLNLSLNAGMAQPPPSQNSAEPKRPPKRKGRKKSSSSIRSSGASSRNDSESRLQRIKGWFAAKIGRIEPGDLREVLLGLGVAAGVATAVVIVVKTLPLTVTVFAILGLALTLKLWQQIRFLPRPF